MNARDAIPEIANDLPKDQVDQLLDYARYLSSRHERAEWGDFGKRELAKAYGDDEPDYTEADLLKKNPS